MKSPHQHHSSTARHLIISGVLFLLALGLTIAAVVLVQGESSSATTPQDCPARHTTAGSYVPAGARPCVLRTGGHPGTGAAGTNDSSSRVSDRKQPGRQAPAVKPPAAPAAKAPAAPAVKPPPAAVRK
ncbi:hypothetical protein ACIOFY_36915 [Streptomyces anulatus]